MGRRKSWMQPKRAKTISFDEDVWQWLYNKDNASDFVNAIVKGVMNASVGKISQRIAYCGECMTVQWLAEQAKFCDNKKMCRNLLNDKNLITKEEAIALSKQEETLFVKTVAEFLNIVDKQKDRINEVLCAERLEIE